MYYVNNIDISEYEIYSDNSFKINKYMTLGKNNLDTPNTDNGVLPGTGGHVKIILPISVSTIKSVYVTHVDWTPFYYNTFNVDFSNNEVYLYYKTEETWNSWFSVNIVIYGII